MAIFMVVLAGLALIAGGLVLVNAKGAIHEIEAFLLFLIGAVTFSGAMIVDVGMNILKQLKSSAGEK